MIKKVDFFFISFRNAFYDLWFFLIVLYHAYSCLPKKSIHEHLDVSNMSL